MKPFCQKCKKDLDNIGGYLKRVNEKGVDPIWECRPSCDTIQTQEQNLLDVINESVPGEP